MLLRASVQANVAIAFKPVVLSRLARRQRIDDALTLVGLAHRARDRAQLLSGGERQRLALARAWAMDSTLMLLDEPTAALDPSGVDAIERIIGEITRSGATVVMTTHSLAQAMRIADRIIFVANGRALEHRPAEQFFQRPESIEGQLFIRAQLPWQTPTTR
jgi:tungstate transport system ATP-binding protein